MRLGKYPTWYLLKIQGSKDKALGDTNIDWISEREMEKEKFSRWIEGKP